MATGWQARLWWSSLMTPVGHLDFALTYAAWGVGKTVLTGRRYNWLLTSKTRCSTHNSEAKLVGKGEAITHHALLQLSESLNGRLAPYLEAELSALSSERTEKNTKMESTYPLWAGKVPVYYPWRCEFLNSQSCSHLAQPLYTPPMPPFGKIHVCKNFFKELMGRSGSDMEWN